MGVRMLPKEGFMIRDIGTEAECTMWLMAEVGNNTFDTLKVAKSGCSTITTKSHDSMGNVHATQRDGPLKCTNEALVLGNIIREAEISVIKFRVVTLGQRCTSLLGSTNTINQLLV